METAVGPGAGNILPGFHFPERNLPVSEFDPRSYNQDGQDATPTESIEKFSWRRWKNLALWRHLWTPGKRSADGTSAGLDRGSPAAPSRWKSWPVRVLLLLLVLPIAGVTIGYFTRLKAGTGAAAGPGAGSAIGSLAHGTTAKPAPGKPLVPVTQPPPASPAPQNSAPAPAQHPPAAAAAPPNTVIAPSGAPPPPTPFKNALPPAPTVTAGTPYPPVVYPARHDKHFGDSCSGRLMLNSSGLQFDCPDDPSGGVQVAINQIGSVDENGIRLTSGKKYHFSIPGMSKISEQELFADWFNRVR
jgi:hypothetical protein